VSINDTEIRGHLHYLFINKNTIKRKRKKINDIEIRGHLLYLFIRKKIKKNTEIRGHLLYLFLGEGCRKTCQIYAQVLRYVFHWLRHLKKKGGKKKEKRWGP
jgi:hypothetical protein